MFYYVRLRFNEMPAYGVVQILLVRKDGSSHYNNHIVHHTGHSEGALKVAQREMGRSTLSSTARSFSIHNLMSKSLAILFAIQKF